MKKVSSSKLFPILSWLLALLSLSVPAYGQAVSGLVPWGDNFYGQLDVPAGATNVVAVASGLAHNLALNADGTVTAWGNNAQGQTNVPPGLSGVRAITAGSSHSLALRTDGTLVAWGTPSYGLNAVPGGMSNVVAIGSGPGASHNLVVKTDGTVSGWGNNGSGQLNFPAGLSNIVAAGGGVFHSMALRADGTLTGWGDNSFGQSAIPAGLSNVISIAVGVYHNVALRADGTVVVWGDNSHGQLNVSASLSNVVAIACGNYHSLAVKADGTLVGWGYNTSGQAQPPIGLTNIAGMSAGNAHSLALAGSAPLIIAQPHDLTVVESTPASFSVGAVGFPAVNYQWRFNGTNLADATTSSLTISPVHISDAGSYSAVVSNNFGSVTSAPALLTVSSALVARCADVTVSADTNCVANGSIDAGSTNASGGTITLTQSPPGPYPLGTNLVTLNVSDDRGGSASCSALVIVVDRTPPQITPPANIVTGNDPNQCGATVTFAQPGASDNCSGIIQVICTPPSGSFFALGTNVVQCTATDSAGNSATNTFSVTVLDRTPPQITAPANILTPNDPDQCGAIGTFPQPSASDNCSGIIQVTCTPTSGSFFPIGTNVVQCTATDAAGNTATNFFTVTVFDHQVPTLICPADIVVTNAPGVSNSFVTYNPTASDNCPGLNPVVCTPPSGSAFGLGVHTVSCSVSDAASNSTTCSFLVTVYNSTTNQAPVPIIQLSPLFTLAGRTDMMIIAPDGRNADLVCDGSDSYDPDNAGFQAAWYVGNTFASSNLVADVRLSLGNHTITLALDDTSPNGRSSISVQVDVLSPVQVIELIEDLVQNSGLPTNKQKPLLATLRAAAASAAAGHLQAEVNQLGAFENKVRAQLGRSNPNLAHELIDAADQLIDALSPESSNKAKTKSTVVRIPANHK